MQTQEIKHQSSLKQRGENTNGLFTSYVEIIADPGTKKTNIHIIGHTKQHRNPTTNRNHW